MNSIFNFQFYALQYVAPRPLRGSEPYFGNDQHRCAKNSKTNKKKIASCF